MSKETGNKLCHSCDIQVQQQKAGTYIFTRIITTKFYHYCVILQILLTAVLALMVFKEFQKAYILEITLTCMMGLDILIRFLGDSTGNYWGSLWNKADIIIVGLLTVLFIFETLFQSMLEIQQFQIFMICLRTASQLYRMFRLIKQEKDSRILQNMQPVDFSFDHENFVDKIH